METEAAFQVEEETGEIEEVTVGTTNELILSTPTGIIVTGCDPIGSPSCAALSGVSLSSLHDSEAELSNISQVPGVALVGPDPSFAAFPDLLLGDREGELKGLVTIQCAGPSDIATGIIELESGPIPRLRTGCPMPFTVASQA